MKTSAGKQRMVSVMYINSQKTTLMTANKIRYLYNSNRGMELIFCENSTISYPTHNHVSVLTVGIVLDGSIVLTADSHEEVYESDQTFILCPYVPHSISARSRYTLLSLCIDKKIATHDLTDNMRRSIMALLMSALDTEKIHPHQIQKLLNCFNSPAACTDWHSERHSPLINSLKKRLELFPEDKFRVEEMAQNAFISKYHFIRSFKAEVGLTPHPQTSDVATTEQHQSQLRHPPKAASLPH